MTEFDKLKRYNLIVRKRISENIKGFEGNEKIMFQLINELIENELSQEELCNQ